MILHVQMPSFLNSVGATTRMNTGTCAYRSDRTSVAAEGRPSAGDAVVVLGLFLLQSLLKDTQPKEDSHEPCHRHTPTAQNERLRHLPVQTESRQQFTPRN